MKNQGGAVAIRQMEPDLAERIGNMAVDTLHVTAAKLAGAGAISFL